MSSYKNMQLDSSSINLGHSITLPVFFHFDYDHDYVSSIFPCPYFSWKYCQYSINFFWYIFTNFTRLAWVNQMTWMTWSKVLFAISPYDEGWSFCLAFNFNIQSNWHQLTLSWRMSLSYRNQCKSMDWFLYDRDLRRESVNQEHGAM